MYIYIYMCVYRFNNVNTVTGSCNFNIVLNFNIYKCILKKQL